MAVLRIDGLPRLKVSLANQEEAVDPSPRPRETRGQCCCLHPSVISGGELLVPALIEKPVLHAGTVSKTFVPLQAVKWRVGSMRLFP